MGSAADGLGKGWEPGTAARRAGLGSGTSGRTVPPLQPRGASWLAHPELSLPTLLCPKRSRDTELLVGFFGRCP